MSFDELEKQFNIDPTPEPENKIVKSASIPEQNKKNDLDKDYSDVRNNLKELIQKGSLAIDGILNLANETEQPRAYEVLSQLIKTVAETNKDLLSMHNQMKTIKGEPATNNSNNTVTNNSIFLGSTAELQKLLRGKMKEIEKLEHNDGDIIDAE